MTTSVTGKSGAAEGLESDAKFKNYYYAKNVQGDVIGLYKWNYSSTGKHTASEIATYEYDAWGKLNAVTNQYGGFITDPTSPALLNPIRYRGYYYDSESGFYYLQSRYYDPVISRFINADSFASTGTGFLGYNMYAYCNNNPVNCADPTGHSVIAACTAWLLGVVTEYAVEIAVATVSAYNACKLISDASLSRSNLEIFASAGTAALGSFGVTLTGNGVREIQEQVERSLSRAKTKRDYRSNYETHHIVARRASRAAPAQEILSSLNIRINSSDNLVLIKTGTHRRLHNKLYYAWVNSIIIEAYNRGQTYEEQKENVIAALGYLKTEIGEMDARIP